MNKKEAAEFLGVSVRAVERLTAKNKLHPAYKQGKHGLEAVYEQPELECLKFEREQLSYPEHSPTPDSPAALTPATMTALVETGSVVANGVRDLIDELRSISQALKPNGHPIAPLADKLTLSLAEAHALSGLSRSFLTTAIHNKKLRAAKRGRGWNIKRADLEGYIKKL